MNYTKLRQVRQLVDTIATEIAAGTKHYAVKSDRELPTVPAVLIEMLRMDRVRIVLPKGRPCPDYVRLD